jgi:hypothetical protein
MISAEMLEAFTAETQRTQRKAALWRGVVARALFLALPEANFRGALDASVRFD